MKKFNSLVEAVYIITKQENSDAVAPVSPCKQEPVDMFNQSANEYLDNAGETVDAIQPDDNIGEPGEVQSDVESDTDSDVELECLGEDGLRIKYSGIELVLPRNVTDKIKDFIYSKVDATTEPYDETDTEESETTEDDTEDETEEDTDEKKAEITESKAKSKSNNPWAICNKSTGGKKKNAKKFEKCVLDVKKKSKITESNTGFGYALKTHHTCHECEHEFVIRIDEGEKATRDDPPVDVSCTPPDCPKCGTEIDVETLERYLDGSIIEKDHVD